MSKSDQDAMNSGKATSRRATLKKIGKYAAVSAPAVTVLLTAAAKPNKAVAASAPAPS